MVKSKESFHVKRLVKDTGWATLGVIAILFEETEKLVGRLVVAGKLSEAESRKILSNIKTTIDQSLKDYNRHFREYNAEFKKILNQTFHRSNTQEFVSKKRTTVGQPAAGKIKEPASRVTEQRPPASLS